MKKKGMSAVVQTLLIVLLAIVIIGVVWVVIRNVVEGGKEQVATAQKCREVDLEVRKLLYENGTNYNLTLHRIGTGDEIEGVKVTLINTSANTYSELLDFDISLNPLETQTKNLIFTNPVEYANKIELTAYFLNEANEEELCPTTITKEF